VLTGRIATLNRRSRKKAWLISVLPAGLWEITFLLLPFLAIVVASFLSRNEFGNIQASVTFDNYKQLAGFGLFGFEPLYPVILARSIGLALVTAVLCALAALPLAFFAASLSNGKRSMAITFLTIPVWTNLLVRTYAWQVLLSPEGVLSRVAAFIGLIKSGDALYPGTTAVLVCLVCDYLPFAALPLYASVEKIDRALIEAAKDLGAPPGNVFRHAILPQIKPGLSAGIIFVFLPAVGQFVIPDLLGGAKTVLLGNVLQQQFGPSRDWPFGATVATVSMLFLFAGIFIYARTHREEVDLL
jgi:spermidine/putrescine transport system permease protein